MGDVADVFVGVVEGVDDRTVAVGIINEKAGHVTACTFPIEPSRLSDYYGATADDKMNGYTLTADVAEFGRFVREHAPDRSLTHFLFEVPQAVVHPNSYDGVPHPVLPTDSAMLKALVYLGVDRYIASPFRVDAAEENAVVLPILRGSQFEELMPRGPKYLLRGICKTFGELVMGVCERAEHAAVAGALVAKNPGAYHYWSSIGIVQSSHDVMLVIRYEQTEHPVYCASEDYVLGVTAATPRDTIDEIPLEYAVAEARYAHLGEYDALKAALIHVCKKWHLNLRCKSKRTDAAAPEVEGPVYPLEMFDMVIANAFGSAEGEQLKPGA
jgi:hypothetical protein